jgi:D-alanyl-D-alanine dipeptidase
LRWFVLERDRRLHVLDQHGNYVPLAARNDSVFDAPRAPLPVSGEVRFHRDSTGRGWGIRVADMVMQRRNIEPPPGATQLRITPLRPIAELRVEALAATPPQEQGSFRQPDLVELTAIDSTIRLEVRYATDNNFIGTPVYSQARAFLQRPAAEALARASAALRPLGYGLLVHDAYRPWYVTKIFWDATPQDKKWLVANPAQGSKHNRGSAIDVTLYVLATGKPVEMPSTYDETTDRAKADYPGGTSLQRHHRALLRRALEHEGFEAIPIEWWHFDYKDWRSYPITNVPFESFSSTRTR